MTEHRHEWRIKDVRKYMIDYADIKAICDCGKTMNTDEIERRLNATEALSARRAEYIAEQAEGIYPATRKMLEEYARILEG